MAGSTGRTSAFAMGAAGDSRWKSAAIKGTVPTWAAQVTAKGSRSQAGIQPSRRSMPGVSRTIAAVPANES